MSQLLSSFPRNTVVTFFSSSKVILLKPSAINGMIAGSRLHLSSTLSNRKSMADNPTQTISYVTISDEDKARKLARLAACVNIVKEVKSIYEWEGKIEEDSESMLIIKSDSSKSAQLTQYVECNHSYDCPELITVRVDTGSKKYLDWVSQTVSKAPMIGK